MVIENRSPEHPVDALARLARDAQAAVDAACKRLEGNELLMSLEARARDSYALCAAGACKCGTQEELERGETASYYAHTPENAPAAYAVEELDGLFIIVGYNGRAQMGGEMWLYQFSQSKEGMRGKFDSRYSCLLTIKSRLAVQA